MQVGDLRNYGVAASDAEAGWSDELRRRVKSLSTSVIFSNLGFVEKVRFALAFLGAYRRLRALDLAPLRARGMKNEAFLTQQLQYLAVFSALRDVKGLDEAMRITRAVMDATAREALLAALPPPEAVRQCGEPLAVFQAYFEPGPAAARAAGCHEMSVVDEGDVVGFDVHWCVWLELARLAGVPEACAANCYADDLAYPAYFDGLGIRYWRTGTLATGARCCEFRFARKAPSAAS